jgi:3-methyladenine DNA glycosylase AlkD
LHVGGRGFESHPVHYYFKYPSLILFMVQAIDAKKELESLADPEKARTMQGFFKTGPGQYGEGDVFIGVTVPDSRQVGRKFGGLPLEEVKALLDSVVHEERMVALLILVQKYGRAPGIKEKEEVVKFYLGNMKQVNNWDLADLSAPGILGAHLMDRDRKLLHRLAKSDSVWERRIAIVATLYFIRNNDFSDTMRIAEMLLHDSHDLIHKAAGWMLREVGKRNLAAEEAFVARHCRSMPRTMLRYAIERFQESKKRRYMKS